MIEIQRWYWWHLNRYFTISLTCDWLGGKCAKCMESRKWTMRLCGGEGKKEANIEGVGLESSIYEGRQAMEIETHDGRRGVERTKNTRVWLWGEEAEMRDSGKKKGAHKGHRESRGKGVPGVGQCVCVCVYAHGNVIIRVFEYTVTRIIMFDY